MKTILLLILFLFSSQTLCYSQVAWSMSSNSLVNFKKGSHQALDLYLFAYQWDDKFVWKGVSLSYDMNKNQNLSILHTNGAAHLVQFAFGVGPDINLNTFTEYGIKAKLAFSLLFLPLQLGVTPRYDFDNKSSSISFQFEYGLGFIAPLFNNEGYANLFK